jgi:hypothetical protein
VQREREENEKREKIEMKRLCIENRERVKEEGRERGRRGERWKRSCAGGQWRKWW